MTEHINIDIPYDEIRDLRISNEIAHRILEYKYKVSLLRVSSRGMDAIYRNIIRMGTYDTFYGVDVILDRELGMTEYYTNEYNFSLAHSCGVVFYYINKNIIEERNRIIEMLLN